MHEKKVSLPYAHKKKEGLAAGSLIYVGDTQPQQTSIRTHIYHAGSYRVEQGYTRADKQHVLWVEITGLEDIQAIVQIAKEFQIANLSLEDVFSTDQRLKLDQYDSYLSVTLRILAHQGTNEQQLTLFLGDGWVLSIAEYNHQSFDAVIRQLSSATKLQGTGSSALLHALIDRVVDQYLVEADELELKTENLEEVVITNPQETSASVIHQQKTDILTLRRMTNPLREILTTLIRTENPFLDRNTTFLLRDVYDHALWLAEECDMMRETVSGIMEVYLSSLDIKMNAIMKVLTIISTIFIPLTFLTGLYGMNFSYMPLTDAYWGFFAILVCCILVVCGMAIYFRRKKWW